MNPKFISFEGIDYCGKSTQIKKLEEFLNERDIPNFVGIEPGSTALGGTLRRVLKRPDYVYALMNEGFKDDPNFPEIPLEQKRTNEAETLLFLAARAEFVEHIVEPKIKDNISVLADRFIDSTVAYQGGGRWESDREIVALINKLNNFVTRGRIPDLTFLLSIDYATMIERSEGKRKDYMESLGPRFYNGVIIQYGNIADRNPERIVKIDGKQNPEKIFESEILPRVKKLYGI